MLLTSTVHPCRQKLSQCYCISRVCQSRALGLPAVDLIVSLPVLVSGFLLVPQSYWSIVGSYSSLVLPKHVPAPFYMIIFLLLRCFKTTVDDQTCQQSYFDPISDFLLVLQKSLQIILQSVQLFYNYIHYQTCLVLLYFFLLGVDLKYLLAAQLF